MKCVRPIGLVLVLVTLPLMVFTAAIETTSRYTLEDNLRFHLVQPQNLTDFNPIEDLVKSNNSSQITHKYELEDNFDMRSNESEYKSDRIDRKISKLSDNKLLNKVSKLSISSSNTSSKRRTNSKLVTASPTVIKSSSFRKNSTLSLHNTHKINIVATKASLTSKITPSSKYATSKIPVKLTKVGTKIFKLTTPRPRLKTTSKRLRPSNSLSKSRSTTTQKPRRKPIIQKITNKFSSKPTGSEIKQNWYEEGVPYPNPNPEISSASPGISLSSLSPITSLSSGLSSVSAPSNGLRPNPMPEITSYSPNYSVDEVSNTPDLIPPLPDDSAVVSDQVPADSNAISNPLSVFNLDMVPDGLKASTGAGGGSPCPTVHISSQVLSPMQRQECSDLSLVINSHIHQNQGTRNPNPNPISTYDGIEPGGIAEDEILADPISEDFVEAADPIGAAQVADAPAAPAAANPGSGGSGGSGGNGSGGPWQFPDLKHMFEAVGFLWNGIGYLLGFLRNPYLYIVPFVLFFILSFLKVLALFPWWIPILVLYVTVKSRNSQPQDQLTFTKHIHKPIKHADGWFWNHQTKSWQNVEHFPHTKRIDGRNDIKMLTHLPHVIIGGAKPNLRTWKRRKRP